jgi:adenine-specific DNA-methyltransferase
MKRWPKVAEPEPKLETHIQAALKAFEGQPLRESGLALLQALGYSSPKTANLNGSVKDFLALVDRGGTLTKKDEIRIQKWQRIEFLFQLTNDEIPSLGQSAKDLFLNEQDYRSSIIESFVFLAIELEPGEWTRGTLATITRELNRIFPMPVIILFRNGSLVSLSVIDRRKHKRDGARDVVDKRISIVKDISTTKPHRAHIDILADIALTRIKVRGRGLPTNFRELYDGWIEKLSAQTLNKRFYQELSNWFLWSVSAVTFPPAAREKDKKDIDRQNQIAVIRLLTRLIFVWFIKEKGLVPDALFEPEHLKNLLKEDPTSNAESSWFYKAILQNLFFATLNTEMSDERKWRSSAAGSGLDGHYLVHTRYRYKDAFKQPEEALKLFKEVPFLNGGLFECLDREVSPRDVERNPDLKHQIVQEGNQSVIRIDGFSDKPQNKLSVPNKIFFGRDVKVDLNDDYQTKGKDYRADGLIELFSKYKFTVEENTPVEEEVALDPELLGKVFENLLASYNTDTKTTARKKSGSFYTPRVVVDYMVAETLLAYFTRCLETKSLEPERRKPIAQTLDFGAAPGELDLQRPTETQSANSARPDLRPKLEDLLNMAVREGNPFTDAETDVLIAGIDKLKALDPACGSGAFPMGLLQKLIHVLHRLDPDNARWKQQNRWPLEASLAAAHAYVDSGERDKRVDEAEAALKKLDRDFSDANHADYARKLYLIDKCIYGVDIQPIAVQIAKLRFFISLVVSQKIDPTAENKNVTALPNLETKLVAANSLIPIERPKTDDLFRNKTIEVKEQQLSAMQARYFGARTAKTKRARREDINRLRDELAELLKTDRSLPEGDAKKMAAWDQFDQNAAAPFLDPEWMFGLTTKFDIVIGNPPYVRQEEIKDQKPLLAKHYKGDKDLQGSYSGTADLYIYFIQRSIELLNPGGAFSFITSNKWYRAKYGERLRGWINRQAQIKTVIDFGDAEVFDAIAYPTILVATRRLKPEAGAQNGDVLRVMNWPQEKDKEEVETFPELMKTLAFDMPQKALTATGWQLEPQAKRGLLDRIRAAGKPLGEYVEGRFYRGILTGFNDAFVIDGPKKDSLIEEHESSRAIIKPFLRGRDIKRWRVEPEDQWLIKIESSENVRHPWTGLDEKKAEAKFAECYPAIFNVLNAYRKELIKRSDQGKYFWELRSCSYWEEFEKPKIIFPDIALSPQFAWTDKPFFLANTGYMIPIVDNAIIITLNSSVCDFFYRQISPQIQNGYYRFIAQYVSQIPIPKIDENASMVVNPLVKLLNSGSTDPRLEQLLNGFVYELFFKNDLHAKGLTIFAEAEQAGLGRLAALEGEALVKAATAFAATNLIPGARLQTMLTDLQTLDTIRIIEGKE